MTTFVFQDSNDISEIDRKKAEHERVKAETQRIENEESRKLDEENRKSSETTRQEFYENTAIPLVENLRDFDSQITKNAKEIDSAKGNYDTLETRLDRENEKIYETINSKDFLPFQGENVTIEHSKVGYTKDMGIEGMIYQNFSPLKEITIKSGEGERTPVVDMLMPIHPGVKVTISFDLLNNDIQNNTYFRFKTKTGNFINACTISPNDKNKKIIYTVNDEIVSIAPYVQSEDFTNNKGFKIDNLIILTGEHEYIPPYFEGIKSVGEEEGKVSILSNNKNLFDGILEIGSLTDGGDNHDDSTRVRTKNYIKIGGMKNIYISSSVDGMLELRYYDSNKKYLKSIVINIANGLASEVTIANNVEYMRFSHVDNTDLNTKYLITSKNIGISDYEPYQIDKKEILLTDGLKGLPSGAGDTVETREDGVYYVKRIAKYTLDGTEPCSIDNDTKELTINFVTRNTNSISENDWNILCNKFPVGNMGYSDDSESIFKTKTGFYISILRSKLTTQDVNGFKAWLQANPVTVYYEIAEPVETKLDITSLNLETFKDITHVLSQNVIAPKLSFKAPVDVPATLSSLRSANTILMAQNTELQAKNEQLEEVNKKQTTKIIELDDTTSFLIEDALTRKLNN